MNVFLNARKFPRRTINVINFNNEFDLLEARIGDLYDVIDVFVVAESNYTYYGEGKPLRLLERLQKGFLKRHQAKINYVLLTHFPVGARKG